MRIKNFIGEFEKNYYLSYTAKYNKKSDGVDMLTEWTKVVYRCANA